MQNPNLNQTDINPAHDGCDIDVIPIDSIDNPLLDPYRDLRNTKTSPLEDWFIAEGKLVVQRLLQSDYRIRSVLLSRKQTNTFVRQIPAGVKVLSVDHRLCSQLVGFDFHAGIMACAIRKPADEQQISRWPAQALLVCCPETSLPDNLGSILRLAASFSAQGVITGPRSVDPFSRRCVRVSMGNIFGLDIFQPENLPAFLLDLKKRYGFEIVAGERIPEAESLENFVPRRRMVFMLGNEAHGLGREWLDLSDRAVQIEMSPDVDSLNVSTAAAIILYRIRQRLDQMHGRNPNEFFSSTEIPNRVE